MHKSQPKNPNRLQKLNALLQRLVGQSLQIYLSDLPGLTTVTKVEITSDLKWAKVWISIVAGDDNVILSTIQKNIYDIQGELNRQMPIKPVPRLKFELDTSPRYAQHINDLIKQIHEEDGSEPKE